MDGFKRPTRPTPTPAPTPHSSVPVRPPVVGEPKRTPLVAEVVLPEPGETKKLQTPTKIRRRWPYIVASVMVFMLLGLVGAWYWYQGQLQPLDAANDAVQRVEITDGMSLGYLAERLEERGVIRSGLAFTIMTNLSGKQSSIKAGTCDLKASYSAREILDKVTAGCHDFKSITFYPGATLEPSLYAKTRAATEGKDFKDMSIRASLKAAGYDDASINEAFSAQYTSPLFEGKPANEGYEGYVFGETYYVAVDATAKEVLQMAFDHFYEIVKENDLVAKFKQHNLSLYEGITLASIVGRELDCEGKPTEERKQRCYGYQQQIAEVFYNRLATGMSLGSDVTSIYASDKLNIPSSVDVDSPYNTRKYAGLTPGPIATAGKLALLSVANPTVGDNIYFLAGDDGLIYFAKDNAGHEANIANHCQVGCGDL